jgi:hypothetical protein
MSIYIDGLSSLGVALDELLERIERDSFDVRLVDSFCELFHRYSSEICDDYEFGHVYRDKIFSLFVMALACEDIPLDIVYRLGKLLHKLDRVEFPEYYS